jgi:regulator of replication initiation timing
MAEASRLREKIRELESEIDALNSRLRAGLAREDGLEAENRKLKATIGIVRKVAAEPGEERDLRVICEETNSAGVRVQLVMAG